MNVKKVAPGKMDALKAMMGGGAPPQDAPGGAGQPGGDVMGPEAQDSASDSAAPPQGGGGDVDQQMNDMLTDLEGASSALEGIQPDDAQDAQNVQEAKAHLDQAIQLLNSCAHPDAEGEPTAEAEKGQNNQGDAEL